MTGALSSWRWWVGVVLSVFLSAVGGVGGGEAPDDPADPPGMEGDGDPTPGVEEDEGEEPALDPDDDGEGGDPHCHHEYAMPKLKKRTSAGFSITSHDPATRLKVRVGTSVTFRCAGHVGVWAEDVPLHWEAEHTATGPAYHWSGDGSRSVNPDNAAECTVTFAADGPRAATASATGSARVRYFGTVSCAKCPRTRKASKVFTHELNGSDSRLVTVQGLALKVRRRGGGGFSESAVIAAGGGSAVHVAELEAKLTHADEGDSAGFPIEITGFDPAYPPSGSAPCQSTPWLSWDAGRGCWTGSVLATASGAKCQGAEPDGEGGTRPVNQYYALTASAKIDQAQIAASESHVSASAAVRFQWADHPQWEFAEQFTTGRYEPVALTEIALGGVPLAGHEVWIYPIMVDLLHLDFDLRTSSFKWVTERLPRTEENDLSAYTRFADTEDGQGDGRVPVDANGQALVYQYVSPSAAGSLPPAGCMRLGSLVNAVSFKAADMNVIK